jgi:hypothetical protein
MLLYLYQEKQIKDIKVKKSLKNIWILKIFLLYLKCKIKGRYKNNLNRHLYNIDFRTTRAIKTRR